MKKKEEILLTEEQIAEVDNLYDNKNITAIKELVAQVFPDIDEKYRDGRSIYGRAIKKHLASKGKKTIATSDYIKKEYELKKKENAAFAKSERDQLYFIYKRSAYFEKSYNRLPIYFQ